MVSPLLLVGLVVAVSPQTGLFAGRIALWAAEKLTTGCVLPLLSAAVSTAAAAVTRTRKTDADGEKEVADTPPLQFYH